MMLVYVVVQIRDNYVSFKELVKDMVVFGLHIVLGVMMGLFLLLPSILYIINYSSRMLNDTDFVFEMDVYVRIITKLFIYERGVDSFVMTYGDYTYQQFSYYIGSLGLFYIGVLFTLKDKISKLYKWVMVCIIFMMFIPVFSMMFSGYCAIPVTTVIGSILWSLTTITPSFFKKCA